MEILLETKNADDIINLVESILEEEFFNLIGMYECSIPEMDYWIKSIIIDRLSDSSISFIVDRFSESGGNLINDYIRIFVRSLDDSFENFQYLVVENEQYIDQSPELFHSDYEEAYINYDKGFELFRDWAYNYINKTELKNYD